MRARYTAAERHSQGARHSRSRKCGVYLERRLTLEGASASLAGGPMNPHPSPLALALGLASAALATDHPIAGGSLVLRDPVSAPTRQVRLRATAAPAIEPSQAGHPRALAATSES